MDRPHALARRGRCLILAGLAVVSAPTFHDAGSVLAQAPCRGFSAPALIGQHVERGFSSGAFITRTGLSNGEEAVIGMTVNAEATSTVGVTMELRGGGETGDDLVYSRSYAPHEHHRDRGGLGRHLFATWRVPADLPAGTYRLGISVHPPDGSQELHRNNSAGRIAVVAPSAEGPTPQPFADRSADPRSAFLYSARGQAYELVAFEKGCEQAAVRVYRDPPGRTGMVYEAPGIPLARSVAGHVATAEFGRTTVRWLSFADRLVQVNGLHERPPEDRVLTTMRGSAIAWERSPRGGFVVQTSSGFPLYEIHAPEAFDAEGRPGSAAVAVTTPESALHPVDVIVSLDPHFAETAAYPIEVHLTTRYHWSP